MAPIVTHILASCSFEKALSTIHDHAVLIGLNHLVQDFHVEKPMVGKISISASSPPSVTEDEREGSEGKRRAGREEEVTYVIRDRLSVPFTFNAIPIFTSYKATFTNQVDGCDVIISAGGGYIETRSKWVILIVGGDQNHGTINYNREESQLLSPVICDICESSDVVKVPLGCRTYVESQIRNSHKIALDKLKTRLEYSSLS